MRSVVSAPARATGFSPSPGDDSTSSAAPSSPSARTSSATTASRTPASRGPASLRRPPAVLRDPTAPASPRRRPFSNRRCANLSALYARELRKSIRGGTSGRARRPDPHAQHADGDEHAAERGEELPRGDEQLIEGELRARERV